MGLPSLATAVLYTESVNQSLPQIRKALTDESSNQMDIYGTEANFIKEYDYFEIAVEHLRVDYECRLPSRRSLRECVLDLAARGSYCKPTP